MKTFVFLTGSSSVGKTTLMDSFHDHYTIMPSLQQKYTIDTDHDSMPTHDAVQVNVHKIGMAFRDIRAQLGNPSWEELQAKPEVGIAQQNGGMQVYEDRILTAAHSDMQGVLLFERNPLDIIGYSYAFGLPLDHIQHLEQQALKIFQILTTMHKVVFVYRKVDWSFPYDRQNNARPDERVRRVCDHWIGKQIDFYSMNGMPNLTIHHSVNKGEAEVDEIMKLVVNGYSQNNSNRSGTAS